MKLRKDENVYQYNQGVWCAEFYAQGMWHKLGDYGSKSVAIEALIKIRTK